MYFTTIEDTQKNIVRGLQSLQNITRGTLVSTTFNFPCELLAGITMGGREWHKLKPFGVLYYLEYIESMHTPSWKRRIHGCSSIVLAEEIKEIHKALANLIYMDTVDEIKSGLLGKESAWNRIDAQMHNEPGDSLHCLEEVSHNILLPRSTGCTAGDTGYYRFQRCAVRHTARRCGLPTRKGSFWVGCFWSIPGRSSSRFDAKVA
jgi:hypothetical protein